VFNRQDFVERSRLFIPVYIDGDAPAAQQLGARFKVGAYPTMILFRPDGAEVTRLPGEVDAQQYMQVLALGMNATRPVKQLLATAARAPATLSRADWRLLAYYSWETDEQAAVPSAQVPATLLRLARTVPAAAGDAATRLELKALAAVAEAPEKQRPAFDRTAALSKLRTVLADPTAVRDHFSALTYSAADMVLFLTAPGSDERKRLATDMDAAFARLAGDVRLSQTDRLTATLARVELVDKLRPEGEPSSLPPSLLATARSEAARADRETTDRYERQSVISAAAYVLREAGRIDESDAMLERELARSPAPYYFMLSLGSNARKRGDRAAALDWYQRAYETSVGPATRLQWGSTYVRNLVELAPQESARIERTARAVLAEIEPKPESFHARNASVLKRLGRGLNEWGQKNGQQAIVARLRVQLDDLCARLPAGSGEQRACSEVFAPPGVT
jgi:tetratricopeptide (TPR) repeat protein